MNSETESVAVVVFDAGGCWLGTLMDVDVALTLIAISSEDPSCWDDFSSYWTRYRSPAVCEFFDSLTLVRVDRATAVQTTEQDDAWVVIDLLEKRIVTGRDFMLVGRDQAFTMTVDENGNQPCPLSVHLPPWWELREQVDASVVCEQRQSPIRVPRVNRDVLFGDAMINDLAARILEIAQSERWSSSDVARNERTRYDFTIEVHRDWLMTPREDLDGRMPRQLLHGAHEWIDQLVWSQRIRFDDGAPIIAAPDDVVGYETAPMGSEEMVVYFDLCRELIAAGWLWCTSNNIGTGTGDDVEQVEPGRRHGELAGFLREAKAEWLASPFEGGSPPSFIMECSRRRVPRGAGVPIVGMTERESEEHAIDCDCPLCDMMAEGFFGPGFVHLDGHHLDLDDEFAFSMHETREAWETQQCEFAELSAKINREMAEGQSQGEAEPDEFASSWSSPMSDDPLPGDPGGHMKLAFLLAEIVSMLESADASDEEIKKLNLGFRDFRTCGSVDLADSGKRLAAQLESLTERYPELVSRLADLQSRIDERIRLPLSDTDLDIPF